MGVNFSDCFNATGKNIGPRACTFDKKYGRVTNTCYYPDHSPQDTALNYLFDI